MRPTFRPQVQPIRSRDWFDRWASGLGLVLALTLSAPLAADWGLASPLAGAGPVSTQFAPSVAVGPDHSAIVAWRTAGNDVWIATREGADGVWSSFEASTDTCREPPLVAANDAGDAIVAWTGYGYVFARYRKAHLAWEPTQTLEINDSAIQGRPRAAINNLGDVALGWVVLDGAETGFEVHTVVRRRQESWPATGTVQVTGDEASVWGELAVAIDDQGRAAVVWQAGPYTTFSDDIQSGAYYLRGATRPPDGTWTASFEVSPRAAVPEIVACNSTHPAVPTARVPVFVARPETGQLALAYAFDPTAYQYVEVDARCYPSPADATLRVGIGSVATPPLPSLTLGTEVLYPEPSLGRTGERLALGWLEGDASPGGTTRRNLLASGSFDTSLAAIEVGDFDLDQLSAGALGPGGGVMVGASYFNFDATTHGLGYRPTSGADDPIAIADEPGSGPAAVAGACAGYALAAIAGGNGVLQIAEYASGTPACTIFADGFETGDRDRWAP